MPALPTGVLELIPSKAYFIPCTTQTRCGSTGLEGEGGIRKGFRVISGYIGSSRLAWAV